MKIQASILDWIAKEGKSQTSIASQTRQNRQRLKPHLERMLSFGLIKTSGGTSGHVIFSVTDKGIKWLEMYENLADESSPTGRNNRIEHLDFQTARH